MSIVVDENAAQKILIVDDEPNIIELARLYLDHEGFETDSAEDGQEALEKVRQADFDLMILDLMLPKVDGWQVCQQIRINENPAKSELPIIMLTARNDEIDRIVGLEMGADDYLGKPFNPRELVARIRAILRRVSSHDQDDEKVENEEIHIKNLTLLPGQRRVLVDDEPVILRMKAFDLLLFLAQRPGEVIRRERLLEAVWGWSDDYTYQTRTVDVHVALLRKTLQKMKPAIPTVWGVGYKLNLKPTEE